MYKTTMKAYSGTRSKRRKDPIMKRYDTDEEMHSALDVFLFDTLTDPSLAFANDVPAEPAVADLKPVEAFAVEIQSKSGAIKRYDATHLSSSRSRNVELMARAMQALVTAPDDATRGAIRVMLRALIDVI